MRDAAAVLTLAVESGSTALDRDALVSRVSAGTTRAQSTQEQVWTLLAANALIGSAAGHGLVDNVNGFGNPNSSLAPYMHYLTEREKEGEPSTG